MKRLNLEYIDRTFWVLFIALVIVSVLALFSASSSLVYDRGSIFGPVGNHIAFILLGTLIAFSMQYLPSRAIRPMGYFLLIVSVICLYLIIIPGSPFVVRINGAARWFKIPGTGFRFQPSELAKLSLIIVLADMLSRIRSEADKRKYFYRTLGISGVVIFPILVNNLSTAIILVLIVAIMWFLARIPWRYILTTGAIVAALLVAGYLVVEFGFVRPHRQMGGLFGRAILWTKRVDSMVEELHQPAAEFHLTDENYQRSIAKVAIARGGKSPFGVLPGNSQERDYLPLAYADYIFAIIVEESGWVGALFLCFIYLAILFRACLASSRFGDSTAGLMVMGLALMLTCQALISMMVAVGLGPVTGQPLPLISRGGTSVLITSVYFGIMMCVSREQAMLREQARTTRQDSFNAVPDINID